MNRLIPRVLLVIGTLAITLQIDRAVAQQLPIPGGRLDRLGTFPVPNQQFPGAETLGQQAPPALLPSSSVLIDRPINRAEYLLGAGDVLTLSVFGFRSQIFNLVVTPEGTVVIPTIGVTRVGGMNINEAERELARHVRRIYQEVEVNLSLSSIRSFKLFLVGDVADPGLKEANPVTRVSELLPPMDSTGVIRRNIRIRRVGDETLPVDLARFLLLGELSHNPTVREGDIVQVSTIDATVTVEGRVATPGIYEFREGETLAEILELANSGGSFRSGAADSLILMRVSERGMPEILSFPVGDAAGAIGGAIPLRPFDAIYVPGFAHYTERNTVTITGEVAKPGRYPITPGVTTVGELIQVAGGFTEDASLLGSVLRRPPVDGLGSRSIAQLESVPPELLSVEDRRILEVSRRADETNVVLDFDQPSGGRASAYSQLLLAGDSLHIPEHRDQITIIGAVSTPGILRFELNQPLDHYVELAGGYTRLADVKRITVFPATGGAPRDADTVSSLRPGDMVVIPFRRELTPLERIQTVQGIVSTVSGVILSVVGLGLIVF